MTRNLGRGRKERERSRLKILLDCYQQKSSRVVFESWVRVRREFTRKGSRGGERAQFALQASSFSDPRLASDHKDDGAIQGLQTRLQ